MISIRPKLLLVVLSAAIVGCGQAVEEKKGPAVDPAKKAEQDKAHADAKAGGGTATPEAPK